MNQGTSLPQWQCSVDILNPTLYRRFQHASLHNPVKNRSYSTCKRKSAEKQNTDAKQKVKNTYKLPLLNSKQPQKKQISLSLTQSSTKSECRRFRAIQPKNLGSTCPTKTSKNIHQSSPQLSTFNPHPKSTQICDTGLSLSHQNKLQKIIRILFPMGKFGQRDKYFSYCYNLALHIYQLLDSTENKGQVLGIFTSDMNLLMSHISKSKSTVSMLKQMEVFRKNEDYFKMKRIQTRILFHLLSAELNILEFNIEKAIEEFQFCQYHSRRENLYSLIIGFLWEITNLNISLLRYDEADNSLRNLLEMGVVCKNKHIITFGLERISMVYYYKGNAVMGQYYLKKAISGLTAFQTEIYTKQYDQNDEIKRLQIKLFNLSPQEKITKRKNNPKFEMDVWREAKQQYEKQSYDEYIQKVNKMLKMKETATNGKKIKKMAAKMISIGQVKEIQNIEDKENHYPNPNSTIKLRAKEKSEYSQSNCSGFGLSQSRNCVNYRKKENIMRSTAQNQRMENVTCVIKTHLSMNRQNNKCSKEHRWNKLISFIFQVQTEIKKMAEELEQKNLLEMSSS